MLANRIVSTRSRGWKVSYFPVHRPRLGVEYFLVEQAVRHWSRSRPLPVGTRPSFETHPHTGRQGLCGYSAGTGVNHHKLDALSDSDNMHDWLSCDVMDGSGSCWSMQRQHLHGLLLGCCGLVRQQCFLFLAPQHLQLHRPAWPSNT